ncbi:hypothetical protein DVH24_037884 [Malus domestica]|uniref:Uncharacterized protein n=1 Tax=Malus domestica TaxID=3750 RepID=A0A498JYL5_MALDO|nr:hypothetical protein DVH24_037884 [Malus domestica]
MLCIDPVWWVLRAPNSRRLSATSFRKASDIWDSRISATLAIAFRSKYRGSVPLLASIFCKCLTKKKNFGSDNNCCSYRQKGPALISFLQISSCLAVVLSSASTLCMLDFTSTTSPYNLGALFGFKLSDGNWMIPPSHAIKVKSGYQFSR